MHTVCHLHSTVQFSNFSSSLVNFELLRVLGPIFRQWKLRSHEIDTYLPSFKDRNKKTSKKPKKHCLLLGQVKFYLPYLLFLENRFTLVTSKSFFHKKVLHVCRLVAHIMHLIKTGISQTSGFQNHLQKVSRLHISTCHS